MFHDYSIGQLKQIIFLKVRSWLLPKLISGEIAIE